MQIDEGSDSPTAVAFGDVARARWYGPAGQTLSLWLLMGQQREAILFTWLVTGDEALDAEAAAIVVSAELAPPVPPLLLSVALGAARFSLDTTGSLLSSVLLLTNAGGLRKTLPIAVENDAQLAIFTHHVRNEVEASRADAVAVLAEAEGRSATGEPQRFLSIYLETSLASQRFLLPLTVQASDTGGRLLMGDPFEVSVGEDPLTGFFARPA